MLKNYNNINNDNKTILIILVPKISGNKKKPGGSLFCPYGYLRHYGA